MNTKSAAGQAISFLDPTMDADVAWAKRQETIRGVLKLFRVIVAGARQHAEAIQRDFGITAAQYWILSELARAPGSRPLDVAKAIGVILKYRIDAHSSGLVLRQSFDRSSNSNVYFVQKT